MRVVWENRSGFRIEMEPLWWIAAFRRRTSGNARDWEEGARQSRTGRKLNWSRVQVLFIGVAEFYLRVDLVISHVQAVWCASCSNCFAGWLTCRMWVQKSGKCANVFVWKHLQILIASHGSTGFAVGKSNSPNTSFVTGVLDVFYIKNTKKSKQKKG